MFRKILIGISFLVSFAVVWIAIRRWSVSNSLSKLSTDIVLPVVPMKRPPIDGERKPPLEETAPPAQAPAKKTRPKKEREDDLTLILGIGPVIAAALKAADVTTFAKLAGMEVADIQVLLNEAGIRLARPQSWPEQASLAAAGDQKGFEDLLDKLRAESRA